MGAPLEARGVGGPPAGELPGPFAVGRYARKLQEEMRRRARVRLVGEVTGIGRSRVQAYFELRDAEGAVPCVIWLDDLESAGLPEGGLRDGVEVVVSGGPDYYPGGGQASPSFAFRATSVRLAGEGDLLARLEALRKQLRSEGLFELQRQLPRPALPKGVGVVTAEGGAARRDLLAGLRRRGWAGTVVWAFAPVQDRRAAPAITAAIQELAARPEIEVVVIARGGGSLADLWAFCDETLCRTVAMLRVPVISAIGHERDSTLLDDVAAVACSTPTHAPEAIVPLDCRSARLELRRCASSLERAGERAVGSRTRHLVALARGPARALRRERLGLNQTIREVRAASERGLAERLAHQRTVALVLRRAAQRGFGPDLGSREAGLRRALATLRAHDPERTLERGYALAETDEGNPLTSAEAAAAEDEIRLRFADGRLKVHPAAADLHPVAADLHPAAADAEPSAERTSEISGNDERE
jgi:exodeoxyribonuclease VII large subunit